MDVSRGSWFCWGRIWDELMIIRQKTKQTNKNQTVLTTKKAKDCGRKITIVFYMAQW